MNKDPDSLAARRDELVARLQAIHRDLGRGLEKDYEEQAIQLENLEVLQEIARVAQTELEAINLELAKLKTSHKET